MTSKRMPYFWLTPPASFTLIGRVCHSSESFAKNEQRLLFSPTNLCQVRVFFFDSFFVFFPLSCFGGFWAFLSSQPPVDKNNWLFFSSCLVWLLFCSHYTTHVPRHLLGFVAKCSQVNLKWLWPHKSKGFSHPKVIRSYNNAMQCQYFRFKNYSNSSFTSTVMAIIMRIEQWWQDEDE